MAKRDAVVSTGQVPSLAPETLSRLENGELMLEIAPEGGVVLT